MRSPSGWKRSKLNSYRTTRKMIRQKQIPRARPRILITANTRWRIILRQAVFQKDLSMEKGLGKATNFSQPFADLCQMKAAVLKQLGEMPVYGDFPDPIP